MTFNKLTLEFHDRLLEREFKDKNDFSIRIYYRVGASLSAFKWLGLNLSAYLLLPEQFFNILSITVVLVLPLLSAVGMGPQEPLSSNASIQPQKTAVAM